MNIHLAQLIKAVLLTLYTITIFLTVVAVNIEGVFIAL